MLRGLHYQLPPKAQGKLIRAIQGDIFVVVVDIRKDSPTFGQWFSEVLSATNKKQFWIPMALRMDSLRFQKQRKYPTKYLLIYAPECERCIACNNPETGIIWPIQNAPLLSKKDPDVVSLYDAEGYD